MIFLKEESSGEISKGNIRRQKASLFDQELSLYDKNREAAAFFTQKSIDVLSDYAI